LPDCVDACFNRVVGGTNIQPALAVLDDQLSAVYSVPAIGGRINHNGVFVALAVLDAGDDDGGGGKSVCAELVGHVQRVVVRVVGERHVGCVLAHVETADALPVGGYVDVLALRVLDVV